MISYLRSSMKFKKMIYVASIALIFLYCFSVPSFGSRGRWNYIVYALMILLAFLDFLYFLLFEKPKLNRYFLIVPLFIIFSLLGTTFYSHDFRSYLTLVLLGFSFFILFFSFCIVKNKKLILLIMIGGLSAFSIYYIYTYRLEIFNIDAYISGDLRLGMFFDNPNAVSAFATIGIIMAFYCLLFWKSKIKYIFILPLLLFFLVGISTGSRTFIVAFIVIVITILFLRYKKHPLIFFFSLTAFVLFVIVLFNLPFLTTLRDRFIRIIWTFFTDSDRVDTSSLERVTWMNYGFFLGNKYLLTGTGAFGFSVLSGVGTYTHSNYSEVWCDFGLIGFLLFYITIPICLFKCIKNKNNNVSLVVSIFIYYILISFSNVYYYTKFYYLNLAFIYYLTFGEKEDISYHKINSIYDSCRHIVITSDGMGSGGAEKVIASLSNGLSSKGFQVTIIGVSTHDTKSFYKLDDRVNYITLHNGGNQKIKSFKRVRLLRKIIKSLKPDVVISFLPHVNVYTYYATLGMKVPVIVSERNNPKVDPKGLILRRLKKIAFYQADGAVFQTKESTYYYRKSIRNKSTVIYNPVEQRLLDIKAGNQKNKVILSVGRLTEQKNFKCLIDAFALFSTNHLDYILRIYGEGHLQDELLEYAVSKGIGEKFELLPPDPNWQEKEKDDAMFILSSDYEGMPNALLEAMVIGIPCISTDCPSGGPLELIKDGENGYLVKVGDSTEMAKKMELILEDPLIYNIEDYSKNFNQTKICDDWLDFIKIVMERKLSS